MQYFSLISTYANTPMTHCTHHTTQVADMFGAGLPVLAVDFGCIGELVEVSVRVSMMWRLFWLKMHEMWICEMNQGVYKEVLFKPPG